MTVTLDSIRQAADAKYLSFQVDIGAGAPVTLLNILRLADNQRTAVVALMTELETLTGDDHKDDPDGLNILSDHVFEILRLVTADGRGDDLVSAINGDVIVGMDLVSQWIEATSPKVSESPISSATTDIATVSSPTSDSTTVFQG